MKFRLPTYKLLTRGMALVLLAAFVLVLFFLPGYLHIQNGFYYLLFAITILLVVFIVKEWQRPEQLSSAAIKAEKSFRALAENSDGIIALLDEKSNTIFRSSPATRITGWAYQEFEKKPLLDFIHPDDKEAVKHTILAATENPGKPLAVSTRLRHKDGHYIWVEGLLTNMLDDPDIGGTIINLHSISKQKEAEQKIVKASRLYLFISQINQMIVRVKDEDTLFAEACRIAVDIGKFRMAWIGLLDETTKNLLPVVHAGEEKAYLSKIIISCTEGSPEGKGPTGVAIREGRYIFCNDIEKSPEMAPWKEAALGRNYHSSMSLPIKKNGIVIGAFTVYADVKNFFDAEQIALLEESTSDLSFALDVFEKEKMRKQSAVDLLESEQRYHTLAESAPVGIFHTDASGYTTYVNAGWCRISGMRQEDALGNGWLNAVHQEDKELLASGWQKATDMQEISVSEYRFVRQDGTVSWVLGQAIPQRNLRNEIVGYIGTTTDITERKETEQRLLKAQEIGKLGYWQQDLQTEMIWASRQAMIIYGFPPKDGELSRAQIAACIIDIEKVREAFTNLITFNKEYNIEIRINPADGAPVKYISAIATTLERNLKGEPVRIMGTIQDITERCKAEQEIAKIYKEKETTLNRINDAMISVDNDWRYTFINDAALATHPLGREQTIGKTIWDIHPEMKGTPFWYKYHEAMATRKMTELESFYAPMDVWFSVKIYPSHDGLTIFYTDITEQVNARNEIIKEKNISDSIINSLPGIFYLYTSEGKFLRWNKNFEKITMYGEAEIRQMHPLDFFDTGDKGKVAQKIDNTFRNGEDSVQADLLLKSKEKIPYYFTGRAIEYDGNTCLAGVGIDFTENTRAQLQIKENTAQLRQLTAHLQSIREDERKRIGREIHDDLGQQLTAIKMDAAWIDKQIAEEAVLLKKKLKNIIGLLDGSNLSIRRILKELRPIILDDRGLLESIEWLGKQITENKSISVHFTHTQSCIEPDEAIANCIFRIYQEALTNISRYAGPCEVKASLNIAGDTVEFSIADNGLGFDPSKVQKNKSFGILGMKERVLSLGGMFEMDAAPGKGTAITIQLPVHAPKET